MRSSPPMTHVRLCATVDYYHCRLLVFFTSEPSRAYFTFIKKLIFFAIFTAQLSVHVPGPLNNPGKRHALLVLIHSPRSSFALIMFTLAVLSSAGQQRCCTLFFHLRPSNRYVSFDCARAFASLSFEQEDISLVLHTVYNAAVSLINACCVGIRSAPVYYSRSKEQPVSPLSLVSELNE